MKLKRGKEGICAERLAGPDRFVLPAVLFGWRSDVRLSKLGYKEVGQPSSLMLFGHENVACLQHITDSYEDTRKWEKPGLVIHTHSITHV